MVKNLIKIGDIIKNDNYAKSVINPFLYDKKSHKIVSKNTVPVFNKILILIIDLDNKSVDIDELETYPETKFKETIFKLSTADKITPHLIGSRSVEEKNIEKMFSYSAYEKSHYKINNISDEYLIHKIRLIIGENSKHIVDSINKIMGGVVKYKIFIKQYIIKDGVKTLVDENTQIINEMVELFTESSKINNSENYVFKKTYLDSFSVGSYGKNGLIVKSLESAPIFNKEDFISYLYGLKYKNLTKSRIANLSKKTNYYITIIPMYDNICFDDIEKFIKIDVLNPIEFFNFLSNFIELKSEELDIANLTILKRKLRFTLTISTISKEMVINNVMVINSIPYLQILDVINNMKKSYSNIFNREMGSEFLKRFIYYYFNSPNELSPDAYNQYKIKFYIDLYKGKLNYSKSFRIDLLVSKIEYYLLNINDINEQKSKIINNIKYYLFMEKLHETKSIMYNDSYFLGCELARYESFYRDDRENLQKFIIKFSGNIRKKIRNITNVVSYYNELTERLTINGADISSTKKIEDLLIKATNNFNANEFIIGYFLTKYNKTNKNDE